MKKTAAALFIFIFVITAVAYAKIDPTAIKYYNYGMKYHKQGNYKNAITYYNAAVKKERQFWQAWLGLGICYYNMRKYRNARLIFKYVLSLKPDEKTAQKYYSILNPKKDKNEQRKSKEEEYKTKGDMMWRSALLPGLGQFYNGELIKGYLYSLSYLVSIGAIIKYTIDQQDAVSAYDNTNYDFDTKYAKAEESNWRVFVPIGTAATVWAVSILDAWITGKDPLSPDTYKNYNSRVSLLDENTVAMNIVSLEF